MRVLGLIAGGTFSSPFVVWQGDHLFGFSSRGRGFGEFLAVSWSGEEHVVWTSHHMPSLMTVLKKGPEIGSGIVVPGA